MKIVFRLVGALVLLLALACVSAPVLAQGSFFYSDDAGLLDRSAVEQAAEPLIRRGAQVAIYTADRGEADEFNRRLMQDGLMEANERVNPDTIAIFVSLGDRYSEILYGDRWNEALRTNDNAEQIRSNELNPRLAEGDFTGGFVAALEAIDAAIASPPQAGGGTSVNVESGTFVPVVLGGIFLVLLLVGGPIAWSAISKRRAAAQALSAARQAMEAARMKAGAAIADFGRELRDVRDKAQFDRVSYPGEEVDRLAQLQNEAETLFTQAQASFDQAEEHERLLSEPTVEKYQAIEQAYAAVLPRIEQARQLIAQAQERRADLDRVNAQAPGEVDRSKKALADVADRLAALAGDFNNPDAVLSAPAQLIERAEALLEQHRAADAIAAAVAASASIDELERLLVRYTDIRDGIAAGRAAAERAAAQGYRVDAGLRAFNTAEGVLRQAAAAIERNDPAAADPLLDQAEAARAEGVLHGGGLPALHRENDERLRALEEAGEQLNIYIEEGHQAFDQVDEFAESTWSDIRGNGSEAEAAADRAQALWERARTLNTMEQQGFVEAARDIEEAEDQISYARTLIDTILQRLKDLQEARAVALQEVEAAEADIEQGRAFVRANDPDVGAGPEQALRHAAELIERARAEINQPKPDWLAVVKDAQEANRLADEALVQARDEVATMNKLREQVARAQKLATAEVQKIVQFTSLHRDDIESQYRAHLDTLQANVQGAYQALQAAENSADTLRLTALREALRRYIALEDSAAQLYAEINQAFREIEQRRRRVHQHARTAEMAIARAERAMQSGNLIAPPREGVKMLDQARQALATIGVVRSEPEAQRAIDAARQAQSLAERAEQIFIGHSMPASSFPHHHDDSLGDFVAGALIGAMLNQGRRGRGSGWGGSWGGSWSSGGSRRSSSGRSWSSGGRSGGGFGGGGRSGGGW